MIRSYNSRRNISQNDPNLEENCANKAISCKKFASTRKGNQRIKSACLDRTVRRVIHEDLSLSTYKKIRIRSSTAVLIQRRRPICIGSEKSSSMNSAIK